MKYNAEVTSRQNETFETRMYAQLLYLPIKYQVMICHNIANVPVS